MKTSIPEEFRLTPLQAHRMRINPILGSDESCGRNGMFLVPRCGVILRCMISDGACVEDETGQWEHVSISLPNRCPTWEEMCFVKNLFFEEHETVIQYHPPKSEYVNNHPYCLHLWRPKAAQIPLPPSILVGLKGITLR